MLATVSRNALLLDAIRQMGMDEVAKALEG